MFMFLTALYSTFFHVHENISTTILNLPSKRAVVSNWISTSTSV